MYGSILVGTDGSATAAEAVRQAIELARVTGAGLHVVTAYEPVSRTVGRTGAERIAEDPQWTIAQREDVDATLGEVAAQAAAGGVACEVHARRGDPADAILDVAEEEGCDLIVLGNKGITGAKRFLLGSVPNKVSHHAPCDVLIIRTS